MKHNIIFWLLVIILFAMIFLLPACSYKPITGEIKAVNGDTVEIRHYSFRVLQNVPKVGERCIFTPTKDTTKINSTLLKH